MAFIINRVWIWRCLETYHEGIIALSACLAGEVPRYLARGMYEEAKKVGAEISGYLWKGQFLSGAAGSRHPGAADRSTRGLMRMSQETGYPAGGDQRLSTILMRRMRSPTIFCSVSRRAKKSRTRTGCAMRAGSIYVKSEEEMRALFPYAQEALDNTHKIAERCNVEIEFGVTKLPQYDVPDGYDVLEHI